MKIFYPAVNEASRDSARLGECIQVIATWSDVAITLQGSEIEVNIASDTHFQETSREALADVVRLAVQHTLDESLSSFCLGLTGKVEFTLLRMTNKTIRNYSLSLAAGLAALVALLPEEGMKDVQILATGDLSPEGEVREVVIDEKKKAIYKGFPDCEIFYYPKENGNFTLDGMKPVETLLGAVEDCLKILFSNPEPSFGEFLIKTDPFPSLPYSWPIHYYPHEELFPEVLRPEYRFIPYHGKTFEAMRDELVAWAQNLKSCKPPLGIRLYVGPGGAGKSRLAIEVGEKLREEKWLVGFLKPKEDLAKHVKTLIQAKRPIFLVLDYATASPGTTGVLLSAMADGYNTREYPFALVLLDRDATPLKERLQPTMRPGDALLHLSTLETRYITMKEFCSVEAHALYKSAFDALSRPGKKSKSPSSHPKELPKHPLEIILLAWLSAAGEALPANIRDSDSIVAAVWNREKRLWKEQWLPRDQSEKVREKLAGIIEALRALASLGLQWESPEALSSFLKRHGPLFPMPTNPAGRVSPDWVAEVLAHFPRDTKEESIIPPVVPDPLADWVIREALNNSKEYLKVLLPPHERVAGMSTIAAKELAHRLMVFQRTAGRFSELQGLGSSLAQHFEEWLQDHKMDKESRLTFLNTLEIMLPSPHQTIVLRAMQEPLYRSMAELAEDEEDRSSAKNSLGFVLSALGRREEALQATREAVETYRKLAQANSQSFLPDLAGSLNNLGGHLSELGRWEEALQATREAVETYRKLAQANPGAFLPDLAGSLYNLSNRLSELGRRDEALQATREVEETYRKLAQANPGAFLPNLAMSLYNLSVHLSALNRHEEALKATREAVDIRRQLAQANPQAYLPYLAGSLNNLSISLFALNRHEEALKATREAVDIRLQLAQANPQAYLPDLAGSLNNLGAPLSALGRHEGAFKATREAVYICRKLAKANPQPFLPDLAMSLNNLGIHLSALGRWEEALQATRESVDIRRQLAQANPQAYLPDLAGSMDAYGYILNRMGKSKEGLNALIEGIKILSPFFLKSPGTFVETMRKLYIDYHKACQNAEQEPDSDLLAPILKLL